MFHGGGTLRHLRRALCIALLLPLAALITPGSVAAAPAITGVTPVSGSVAGGTSIGISGSGFAPGVTVTVGGVAATAIQLIGTTVITCLTPPHAVGPVDVTVTDPFAAFSTLPGAFTYQSGGTPVPASTTTTEFTVPTTSATPLGIAAGPDGNLWFTENAASANKVAKVTPGGAVTEFTLPNANSTPDGIARGPDSNLWFTEFNGNRIGTITTGGAITEFTANITAGAHPSKIAAGPDGNLWFTEFDGNRIGRITPGGTVTEFAVPTGGSQPFGIAPGPDGNVWFTEFAAFKVGKIARDGTITEVVGTSGKPRGIATGPDGNLWVAEDSTNKIARITPAGAITEFAAGGNPFGIAAGPDGGVWFTEPNASSVARIDPASGAVTAFPAPTGGSHPRGIAAGPDHNLWFAESTGNRIGKLPLPTPAITGISPSADTVAGGTTLTITGTGFSPDAAITLGGQPTIPLNRSATQMVARTLAHAAGAVDVRVVNGDGRSATLTHDFTFAQVATSFSPTVQEFTIPTHNGIPLGIALGPDGNLWFTEFGSDRIGRITPGGAITEFFSNITAGSGIVGITVGPGGNLWFAEGAGRIGRITPTGAVTEFSSGITANSNPSGIAAGPDGNVWFAEGAGRIGKITPAGAVTEFPTPTASSFPAGIAPGPDGNLWFTELSGNKIGRITTDGTVTEFSVPSSGSHPDGIAAGSDGNLWFTENTIKIGRINPFTATPGTPGITEFPVPTIDSFPKGIVPGPDGNLWFTEFGSNRVAEIAIDGTVIEFSAIPTNSSAPAEIAAGPDGNLWFTEQTGNKIGVLFVAPPTVATFSPTTGPVNTTQPVTISGMGFAPGSAVLFGTTPCTGVTVVNPTTITCTAPALPPSTVDVSVVIPGGITGTKQGYIVAPPTITAITPASGTANIAQPVTITGAGFAPGATVLFGTAACTDVTVVNATTITCTAPALPPARWM